MMSRKVGNKNSIAGRKQTSWECYNIFLKGLVDELIDLGASKRIKVVAFQLWASYLQWSGVAFISKKEETVPAMSLGFRNKDAKVLYGVSNLRQKLFKGSANYKEGAGKRKYSNKDTDLYSESLCGESKKPKKTTFDENVEEFESEELNLLDVEMTEPAEVEKQPQRTKIVLKSFARKALKEILQKTKETHDSSPLKKLTIKTKIKRLVYDRRHKMSGSRAPNIPVTTVTLITILRVALQIVGDEIFLGDILRWICEGRLSVNRPKKFVLALDWFVNNDLMKVQRKGFQLDIRNFTHNLSLSDLPIPNLFKLAERYCEELYLPNEFLQLVLKLMVDSKVKMKYSNYRFKLYPDYECRVMAFILFVFKLLFSLDDFTEYQLSKFVDAVNEIESTAIFKIPKLFSWRTWMRYIECRKAVLAKYNASVNQISYNNGVHDENNFFDYWKKVKPSYRATTQSINSNFLSSLRCVCRESSATVNKKIKVINMDRLPSLTPLKTLLKHLMENYPNELTRRSQKLLSEEFGSYSVKYALNTKWILKIAKRLKLKVELIDSSEFFNYEIYESTNSLLALTKTTLPRCDIPVAVSIDSKERSNVANKMKEVISFQPSIHEINFYAPAQDGDTSIKICRLSKYWSFHECHKRMSVEEFDLCARNNFSCSFLWLLRECASIIRADVKELYFELIFVELVLHSLFQESAIKKTSLRVNMKEW